MKNAKKFTCLNDKGEKIDGAIEGAKGKVLAWMKKTFPGVRKAMPQELVPAWVFVHIGEIEFVADHECFLLVNARLGSDGTDEEVVAARLAGRTGLSRMLPLIIRQDLYPHTV